METRFYRPCYPSCKDDCGMEFPWSALPFSTDTCFLEIDCSLRMEWLRR
jgi:hypothetical protein